MSASDEGDGGRPGLGRDVTDTGESPPNNAVTQPIPIVNPIPAAVHPPVVRAVARRAPAALPALGRDSGARDGPRSGRDSAGRRGRAGRAGSPTAETLGQPPAETADLAPAETVDLTPAETEEPPAERAEQAEPAPLVVAESVHPAPIDPGPVPDGSEVLAEVEIDFESDVPPEPDDRRALIATEIALRDASTDEWLMPAEAETVVPTLVGATKVIRPGPALLESDTWIEDPAGESHAATYHGRRRAPASAARLWLAVGFVVALGSAVAVPLALRSSPPTAAVPPTAAGAAVLAEPTAADSAAISGTSSPAASPTTSPSPRPALPAKSLTPSPPRSPTLPPFTPLTMEGETAARGGSATTRTVAGASNGTVVGTLGDRDGGGVENDGWVRFTAIVPTAGQYAVAVFYVFSDGASRNAYVKVNGGSASIHSFAQSPACPCASKKITLTFAAGPNTIEFGNPIAAAPSIDKIVISKT